MAFTSFLRGLARYVMLSCVKTIIHLSFKIPRLFRPPPASQRPTLCKRYPIRPQLEHRIFIPSTHEAHDAPMPLYLDIHGGGFAICTPESDDEFCSQFATRHNILVVSLDYSKSPRHVFPMALNDIVAVAQAVLSDTTLPIDSSRVAIGGFSAGGCLALAAAQMKELKGRLSGVVAWYPVLDMASPLQPKLDARTWPEGDRTDNLAGVWDTMLWAYFRDLGKKDRENPLISPLFASRQDLPEFVFLISAEWDLLAPEARSMAARISKQTITRDSSTVGGAEDTFRWEEVKEREHAFTHVAPKNEDEASREQRRQECTDLYEKVGVWLWKGPYKARP